VDKDGVVNFTDDREKVPSVYRDRVEIETREDIPGAKPPAPQGVASPKKEEAGADIYGRNETWWREKVRPLKDQLKEATGKYESVHHRFMGKAEELSQRRFGSPTQYKMNIIELDRLKDEMTKYQAQIAEAKEMLEKLSKEAEDSKANPEWLK